MHPFLPLSENERFVRIDVRNLQLEHRLHTIGFRRGEPTERAIERFVEQYDHSNVEEKVQMIVYNATKFPGLLAAGMRSMKDRSDQEVRGQRALRRPPPTELQRERHRLRTIALRQRRAAAADPPNAAADAPNGDVLALAAPVVALPLLDVGDAMPALNDAIPLDDGALE